MHFSLYSVLLLFISAKKETLTDREREREIDREAEKERERLRERVRERGIMTDRGLFYVMQSLCELKGLYCFVKLHLHTKKSVNSGDL